jgi:hypothetical protein
MAWQGQCPEPFNSRFDWIPEGPEFEPAVLPDGIARERGTCPGLPKASRIQYHLVTDPAQEWYVGVTDE